MVVGNFAKDSFATHIFETLIDMNYEALSYSVVPNTYDYNNYLTYILKKSYRHAFSILNNLYFYRKKRLNPLLKVLKTKQPDLIIVTHDFFWPIEITRIKSNFNGIIILWFPDAITNFGKGFFLISDYDFLFFKDPFIVRKLRKVTTKPVFYLPECFNPKRHFFDKKKEIRREFISDLNCVGNFHSWRSLFFEKLSKYDFKFFGINPPNWMNIGSLTIHFQGFPVFNETKAEAFLGAKIVLNNLHYGEIWGLNARAFEIAGVGAFQLIDYTDGLNELFEDGKEIISFKGVDDMIRKIDYWLLHENERNEIGKAAKLRSYNEHTYEIRLNTLINTVFNNEHGFNSKLL